MIPAPFDYYAVNNIDEAADLLATYGDEAKILAGGQSLLAFMKLRLAEPQILIDLKRIAGLSDININGSLRIGAMATHAAVGKTVGATDPYQAFQDAAIGLADPLVRNLGTFGGSLAHADPAGDWPALALAFGAVIEAVSNEGQRKIPVEEFFQDIFTTALSEKEILTAVEIPVPPSGAASAYEKISHPASGYPVAGAVAVVALAADGTCSHIRLAFAGIGQCPFRVHEAEEMLMGSRLEPEILASAVDKIKDATPARSDDYATADYRRQLAGVCAMRAIKRASGRIGN